MEKGEERGRKGERGGEGGGGGGGGERGGSSVDRTLETPQSSSSITTTNNVRVTFIFSVDDTREVPISHYSEVTHLSSQECSSSCCFAAVVHPSIVPSVILTTGNIHQKLKF